MEPRQLMKGKKVLVTGSGTGIGRGVALEFAREGADVVFHYAHSSQGALEGAAEARGLGVRAEAFGGDFSKVDQAQAVASRALEFLGGLDVLINNAGITMNRPFEKVTIEQFDTLFSVNVRAMYFVTQSCLPALLASKGAVVNMTSVHGFEAMHEHSVYASTKGAIIAMTRNLGVELAPQGVRVNAIAPGAIVVENHFKIFPDMDPEAAGRDIPTGYIGYPRDIARACIYLASEDARYIIGQTWIIDGGTTSWMPFGEGYKAPQTGQFGVGYVPGL
jgi:NAD(P)-dependent dehydrogenase (short-subunit alcohol dehydrogenase family)